MRLVLLFWFELLLSFGVMENQVSIVKNGVVLKLLPGFKFHPTDEELVVHYLTRRIFGIPLPAAIIPELDVCKSDPWDLPGDNNQIRYFFSSKEPKYPNSRRSNRATGSGYWKASGIDRKVMSYRMNRAVGLKKILVFYQGKANKGTRSDWIMHEYRVDSAVGKELIRRSAATHAAALAAKLEKWVLCRIFLKKRGIKDGAKISYMDPRANPLPIPGDLNEAPTSSCSSSRITDESIIHESEIESNEPSVAKTRIRW